MRSPLIINCRKDTPRCWGLTNHSSSKIAGKTHRGTESGSAPTLAIAPKGCALTSARRVEAASSNEIDSQQQRLAICDRRHHPRSDQVQDASVTDLPRCSGQTSSVGYDAACTQRLPSTVTSNAIAGLPHDLKVVANSQQISANSCPFGAPIVY
jgi:hypothetical protein